MSQVNVKISYEIDRSNSVYVNGKRAKSGVCATLPLPQCRIQLWHESAISFGLSANKRHKSTWRKTAV